MKTNDAAPFAFVQWRCDEGDVDPANRLSAVQYFLMLSLPGGASLCC